MPPFVHVRTSDHQKKVVAVVTIDSVVVNCCDASLLQARLAGGYQLAVSL